MKRLLFILFVSLSSIVFASEYNVYVIYYLPIDADYYIPPTRDYIIKYGTKIEITSRMIDDLFKMLSVETGVNLNDGDSKNWRILITKRNSKKEIIITSDKQCIYSNKKYHIKENIIEDIIDEIVDNLHNTKKE